MDTFDVKCYRNWENGITLINGEAGFVEKTTIMVEQLVVASEADGIRIHTGISIASSYIISMLNPLLD